MASGFLRRPSVQQMVTEQRTGRTDQSKQLWQLLMELWYRGARAAGWPRHDRYGHGPCEPWKKDLMKQVAQNYKSGELTVLDVPVPACKPGGVLVRSLYSLISTGTEMMKVSEAQLSLVGKAGPGRTRSASCSTRSPNRAVAAYQKAMNRLDSYTPLGYSLWVSVEVGAGAEQFSVGQMVAAAGNEFALHADVNWVPTNLCVPVPEVSRPSTPRSPPSAPSPCRASAAPRSPSGRPPA